MSTSQKTVLILEDEPLIAMGLELLIQDLGLASIVAHTVDDALSVIEGNEIDVAVLDYKIRDQNSEPVALALQRRSIPFLICSGRLMDKLTDVFAGAPNIGKPHSDSELRAAILSLLS